MASIKFRNRLGQWVDLVLDSVSSDSIYQALSAKQGKLLSQNKADKSTTLSGYGILDAYTKSEIDALISAVFRYKGVKATVADVEAIQNPSVGDVWFVTADGSEYAWNGTIWEKLGPVIDLSHFITQISIAGIVLDVNSTTITAAQLIQALNIYTKSEVYNKTEVDTQLGTKVPTTRKVNNKALDQDITLDKSDIGLSNVDNTKDTDKPVSTAQQTALDSKLDKNQGIANTGKFMRVGNTGAVSYDSPTERYASISQFPATGDSGKLYIAEDTGMIYIWETNNYSSVGGSDIQDFTGATSSTAGSHGLVPAPTTSDRNKFLKGDGTWGEASTGSVYGDTIDMSSSDPTKVATAIGNKLDANQGSANSGKFMRVGSTGAVSYDSPTERYSSLNNFPSTGDEGKLYIAEDTGMMYVWDSEYVPVGGTSSDECEVSGDVVSFETFESKVKELVVNIEPVQDLHGYDNPWPGGGSKNLWSYDASFSKDDQSLYLVVPLSLSTGVYTISGIFTSGYTTYPTIRFEFRDSNGDAIESSNMFANGTRVNSVVSLNRACSMVYVYGAYITTENYSFTATDVQIESGSTASDYVPYSNICPISGYTGVNIVRNRLDYRKIYSEGQVLQNNILTYEMPVENGTYTLSTNIPHYNGNAGVFFSLPGERASTVNNGVKNGSPRTITTTVGKVWIHVRMGGDGIIPTEEDFKNFTYWIALVDGSTAFTPINITFPSSAGTVYGAKLTINQDGTGTLVVDRTKITIDGTNRTVVLQKESGTVCSSFRHGLSASENGINDNSISNMLARVSTDRASNGKQTFAYNVNTDKIYITLSDSIHTAEDANAYLSTNNVEIAYYLSEPQIYQLTNQQVVSLLKGQNVLWADCGAIDLTYYRTETAYQVSLNTADIAELKGEVESHSDAIEELQKDQWEDNEESGSVVEFDTFESEAKKIVVDINPVQDLHGQESPYPAGGGKNLFDIDHIGDEWVNTSNEIIHTNAAKTNIINVAGGTTLTLSCNIEATTNYVYLIAYLDSSDAVISRTVVTSGNKLTAVAGSNAVKAIAGVYNMDLTDAKIQVEVGSTNTAWSPYSNICTISGWTSADVTRTGEILNGDDLTVLNGYISTSGIYQTSSTGSKSVMAFVKAGSTKITKRASSTFRIGLFSAVPTNATASTSFVDVGSSVTEYTINVPTDCYLVAFVVNSSSSGDISASTQIIDSVKYYTNVSIYTYTFPQSAGTVYGGTLTIHQDGTGTLVVDRIAIVMDSSKVGSSMASKEGFYGAYYNDSSIPRTNNVTSDLICDVLPAKMVYSRAEAGIYANGSAGQFGMRVAIGSVREQQSTQADNVKQFIDENNPTLSYKLKTPVAYDLTAQQVVSLLKGQNVLWADTGDIDVTYYRTKLAYEAEKPSAVMPEVMTGATSSTAGASGLVPAPAAGDNTKYLMGNGTWEVAPGARIVQVTTTVTNTSGSYTNTIQDARVRGDMKAISLEIANPYVFNDKITVTCNDGSVTLSCNDVTGTSVVKINIIKADINPTVITSEEFDILDAAKVDKNQGVANAGKALGINAQGMVEPVQFSGDDFTGATSSTAGTHGYVPAPSAGDQDKVLTGGGTWVTPVGSRVLVVNLDNVTNTSGSYTHTTTVTGMTSDLKAVAIECSDPTIFKGKVTVTTGTNSVTLTCSDVAGSSTVKVSFLAIGNANPLSSTEYGALDTRIGQLNDLNTTDKSSVVDAINEVNNKIPQQITISNLRSGASVYAYKIGNIIEINIDATGSIPASAWTDIGTIDMSYMPAYNVGCMIPNADVKGFGMLRVEASTGKIRIYHALSGSTTFYGIALTYFAIPTA